MVLRGWVIALHRSVHVAEAVLETAAELVLGAEPDAVPRARALVAELLRAEPAETTTNALLVVTELVTNAVLHGVPPVTLRVLSLPGRVRVEVEDDGRTLPLTSPRRPDGMTGRGLELVATVSMAWGVEPRREGKVVWAEVGESPGGVRRTDPLVDVDALLAAWKDEEDRERRYAVRLGSVPTDLLLAAKAHSENVVRELILIRAHSGVSLPAPMAALVTAVTEDFAEARAEIKRQALDAVKRDEAFVDLVLELPLSAADAGERYLAALTEADRHARAARMLTLAPPRSHQVFREWYVQSLVDQLRAAARGDVLGPPEPFAQVLAAEVDRLTSLEET